MTSPFTPEQLAVIEEIGFRTNILALDAVLKSAGVVQAEGSEVVEGESARS